jgi:spermidine synthase
VKHPMDWLGISDYSIGIAVLVTSLLLFRMRGFAGALSLRMTGSWQKFITLEMIILFFILLFPTFLMGTVFPLIMTVLSQNTRMIGRFLGRGYALNTLGSILGAALASFFLIEFFGISFGIKLSGSLALGMGIVIFITRKSPRRRVSAAVAGCALIGLVIFFPLHHPLQRLGPGERLIFYREASSATVSVREDAEGGRMLSINGLDEVPVDPSSILTFRVLAHMPLLLHPDPKQVMVLSLGGAITTSSVATHDVERIDAVELCPLVVDAAELFSKWNHDVLRDPRLRIVLQVGRNYLLTADTRYDVITADATHPWSADSWILYTREFYELVLSSLDENGIFCQWVPLHYLSPEDFKCILRTMRTVFTHLSVWYTGSYVVVLGQEYAPLLDTGMIEKRMKQPRVRKDLVSAGIHSAPSLISLHFLSDERVDRFVKEGPLNTDDRAYLEHSAARCFGVETTPMNLAALSSLRHMPSFIAESEEQKESIERLFLARKKMILGRVATYRGEFESAINSYKYALEIFPEDKLSKIFFEDAQKTFASSLAVKGDEYRRSGEADKAREAYRNALRIDPDEPHAHNGIGLLLYYEGKYKEALSHYDSALKRMPHQAFIRYNKVLALLKSGRILEAEKEIEIIEELEKNMDRAISRDLRKYLAEVKAAQ